MSLLWADDMTTYGVGGQAHLTDGPYAQVVPGLSLVADPDPSGTGKTVLKIPISYTGGGYPSGDKYIRKVFPANKTTVGGALRLWMDKLPSTTDVAPWIVFGDSGNNANLSFSVSTTGAIIVSRGYAYGGTVIGTSSVALTANAWNHIEWKVKADNSTGTVDIYVNGISVLSLTGQDTTATADQFYSQMSVGGKGYTTGNDMNAYVRDLIVWDTAGSYNNDIMGPCFVKRLTVNSDVSFNWAASSGSTGYNLINETGPDDSSYILASNAPPAASLFGLEDLPADVTSIRGAMLYGRMNKSDGGDCNVQMSLNDSTSDSSGSDRPITTAFTYWSDVIEVNATTGLPWTPTDFNAARFKVDRTT